MTAALDFRIKWRKGDQYSWFVRRMSSSGRFYGDATQFHQKVQINFEGIISDDDLKDIKESIAGLLLREPPVEFKLPAEGVIGLCDSRKVIAVYPTGDRNDDLRFIKIANLLETKIRSSLILDETSAPDWTNFANGIPGN